MKIDPQKQFLHYNKNCFNFLSWSELTKHQRILLVSVTRRKAHFATTYIRQLRVWAEVYRQWGVDAVYLMTTDQRYEILAVETMSKGLPVLGDVGGEFAQALAEHCGMTTWSAEELSRYWNYQVLIDHGTLEKVYYQPMDNLVKNLWQHTKNLGLIKQIQPFEKYHLTPYFLRTDSRLAEQVLYYNLYPNADLKNYLLTSC